MRAPWQFIAAASLALAIPAAGAAGEERLEPMPVKPSKETFTRPDKGLGELKGAKAERREAVEEKIGNIDRRIALREDARRDAAREAAKKPSMISLSVSLSAGAVSLSGWAQKGMNPAPGDRVDYVRNLGLPKWLACPEAGLSLALRRRSGVFASAAFLGGDGDSTAEAGGLAYHGSSFAAGTRIESVWESLRCRIGMYYSLSVTPGAEVKACLGAKYMRNVLIADGSPPGSPRATETSDVFLPFLRFSAKFRISTGLFLIPDVSLCWLSFGGEKYFQDNLGLEAQALFAVPLSAGADLWAGYRIEYVVASREDRGMVEASSEIMHGFFVGLEFRMF